MREILLYLGGPGYALAAWFFLLSLALFFVMGFDKFQARRGGRRVPEKRLFLLAALGGAIGGFFGIYAFRHKTRHGSFVLGFPALAALHIALLAYVFLAAGG